MMRAFVAWQPSHPDRETLVALRDALRREHDGRGLRWIDDAQLHVTLRFLGEIEPRATSVIDSTLAGIAAATPSFEASVAGCRYWPDPRSPRVLVVTIESDGCMERLAAAIERAVVAAGVPAERRAYRAHLTLARVGAECELAPVLPAAIPSLSLRCDSIALVQSTLSERGARHETLARHRLAPA